MFADPAGAATPGGVSHSPGRLRRARRVGCVIRNLRPPAAVVFERGAYKDAEQPLAQAAKLAPSNGIIHYHLGMVYYKLGRKDEAIQALRAVLRQEPKLAEAQKIREVLKELEG